MSEQNVKIDEQDRIRSGQSAARGATGDGRTGVPAGEQGISNRPGDAAASDDDDAIEAGPQTDEPDTWEQEAAGDDEDASVEGVDDEDGDDEEDEDESTDLPVEPR